MCGQTSRLLYSWSTVPLIFTSQIYSSSLQGLGIAVPSNAVFSLGFALKDVWPISTFQRLHPVHGPQFSHSGIRWMLHRFYPSMWCFHRCTMETAM